MLELARLDGTGEQIKISVRDAKKMGKGRWHVFVVRSWFKEGRIKNRIYEPKSDPYTKYIEIGNGSLILDLDNYTLSWQE